MRHKGGITKTKNGIVIILGNQPLCSCTTFGAQNLTELFTLMTFEDSFYSNLESKGNDAIFWTYKFITGKWHMTEPHGYF